MNVNTKQLMDGFFALHPEADTPEFREIIEGLCEGSETIDDLLSDSLGKLLSTAPKGVLCLSVLDLAMQVAVAEEVSSEDAPWSDEVRHLRIAKIVVEATKKATEFLDRKREEK